uniref:fibronectin type III domain-containing protein n=1 Tax=Pilimelia terevasa TaxID=53372 RepID=UPI001E5D28E7|nr:fibronectin type III domain-containing protein [Pilimelia terevasa]
MAPAATRYARRVRAWRPRSRGGLVTAVTAASAVVAMGATLLGLSAADNAVANYDASSWLWSTVKGEVARVNGVTARIDTRLDVRGSAQHAVQVTQTDRLLLLRDRSTGLVSALDLATLRATATTPTSAGLGVTVALHGESAFIVDTVQGLVRQLDPRTLQGVGEPVRFPPGITGGVFDGRGRLWVGVPTEGTVAALTAGDPARAGAGPATVRTVPVADAQHDLAVAALDDGAAVLDRTDGTLTSLRGERTAKARLDLAGPGLLPGRVVGDQIPVTVPDQRQVVVVGVGGGTRTLTVPGTGALAQPAVAWAGRFYCADGAGGVRVLDGAGGAAETIRLPAGSGPLELEVRENRLFINAPASAAAHVVDDRHAVRPVDKYADGVLGGDPPPDPPPPPKPRIGPPGAPPGVLATAGRAQARISWRGAAENGSPIVRYVVVGAGRQLTVGARQRQVVVPGLTNGETYRFSVHAVNGRGAGPATRSNPVVPTADVPAAPTAVTARARPDGTVQVSWPRADGLGRRILRYQVTAATDGASSVVGTSRSTSLAVRDLEYGRAYAFTVVAVNDRGAGSVPSPVSESVTPFTRPGPPAGLQVVTAADKAGTVRVSWQAAADNGRPVRSYAVVANGRRTAAPQPGTVDIGGFGTGQAVTVKVSAVNDAGEGAAATARARTVPRPSVTALKSTAGYSTLAVPLRAADAARCEISLNGGRRTRFDCKGDTVRELTPDTVYRYVVYAVNAAGEAADKGEARTKRLDGRVACDDRNGPDRGYCNRGIGVYSGARQQGSEGVGTARAGQTYRAFCRRRGSDGDQSDGAVLDATKYNRNKRSDMWVQITFEDKQRYIPFIWLNLTNGDKINDLPNC